MARVVIKMDDRPDGSVSVSMQVEGAPEDETNLSPALLHATTVMALYEAEIIQHRSVTVLEALAAGALPSEALQQLETSYE